MRIQKITPNIPAVKIMNPVLRILLSFACNPFIPANNPVKENSVQYREVGMGKIVSILIPILKKNKR